MRQQYDDEYLMSLEKSYISTKDGLKLPTRTQAYKVVPAVRTSGCLMLMDTEKERKIGLASRYKHAAMKDGECFIDKTMANFL
jgi:hypothetical protein